MEIEDLSPDEHSLAAELSALTAEPGPERRARIMSAVRSSQSRRLGLARPWRLALAGSAAIGILLAGSIGVAAASRDALPNSPYYALRQIEEQVRLDLAVPAGREDLRISFAEARIGQARTVLRDGDVSNARALLRDSRQYLVDARQNLADVPSGEQGQLKNELDQAQADQDNADSQLNQQGEQGQHRG